MRPRGRGGAQGSQGGAVQRGVWMRKEREEGRPERQGDCRAAPGGEGRKAGEGGGRESGGRKQCSRRGPGRVPLPNAATELRFGDVAPAAGGPPRAFNRGPRGFPEPHTPEAGRPEAGQAEGTAGPGTAPTAVRPGLAPLGPYPGGTPPGQGAGWRGSARKAAGSAAAANLGSPGLRWEEARRPGERKRGPDPPPAAARLREGACPARSGAWVGALCWTLEEMRGVCPRLRPAPTCWPSRRLPKVLSEGHQHARANLSAFFRRSFFARVEASPRLFCDSKHAFTRLLLCSLPPPPPPPPPPLSLLSPFIWFLGRAD